MMFSDISAARDEAPAAGAPGDLSSIVLDGLRQISGSLALIFVVFAIFNAIDFPPAVRAVLVPHDLALVASFAVMRLLIARGRIPRAWANAIVAVSAGLVLSNVLLSLGLLQKPFYTVHVMLVVIGAASFMLSTFWVLLTLALATVAWIVVALPVTPGYLFLHYGFAMFVALTLAATIHAARLKGYRRLHRALDAAQDEIREREAAERSLAESEQRFRSISDQALMGIVILQGGRVVYANEAYCRVCGYAREEVLGWGVDEFAKTIHPEHQDHVMEQARKTQAGETDVDVHYAFRGVTKSGQVKWVDKWSTTIMLGGQTADLVTIIDIDDQRRAMQEKERLEEQLIRARRLESLGRLAGGVAHDFNNLLGGILGAVSVIELERSDDPELAELAQEMKGLVNRGAGLTAQLLGFARQGKYDPRPLDLNQLADGTTAMFCRTRKDIVLRRELQEQPLPVLADFGQVEQVVLNLLLNAGHAMPEGGDLTLRTEVVDVASPEAELHDVQPGRYAKLSVVDTGVGMDAATRERVFEPFFTTRDVGRGTGLGLASAFGILRNHGGFITVHSEPGQGSAFMAHLPITDQPLVEPKPVAAAPRRQGSGQKILVVDDEPQILRLFERMLGRAGYEVLTAASGEAALAAIEADPQGIALVILDMLMPGVSGKQTFSTLRTIAPQMKVLLCSGYSVEGQASALLRQGCNGFLQKPFDAPAVLAKLEQILEAA